MPPKAKPAPKKQGMSRGALVFGAAWRTVALGVTWAVGALPLLMYFVRVHEGLYEDTYGGGGTARAVPARWRGSPHFLLCSVYWALALAAGALVFPALIFLGWYDSAIGSIVPLMMLAVIMGAHELTDPDFATLPADALAGRTALVVGGSRGIGLAVAKEYLKRGAAVAITWRTPSLAVRELEAHAAAHGTRFLGSLELDLSDDASLRSLADRLRAAQPGLLFDDVVINAGENCAQPGERVAGVERTASINALAAIRTALQLVPLMSTRNASILFSSSPSARMAIQLPITTILALDETLTDRPAMRCGLLYGRSKLLLDAGVAELAAAHPHIRWHSVYTGPVHTDLFERAITTPAEVLYTPAVAHAAAMQAWIRFWGQVLARAPQSVARQYAYGAWPANTLTTNGCAFYYEDCLKPLATVGAVIAAGGVLRTAVSA